MTIGLLALALTACKEPEDDSGAVFMGTGQDADPDNIVRRGNPVQTNGNNQTLVPDRYENGCYVVSQRFNSDDGATLQFVNDSGYANGSSEIYYSHMGMLGWGVHTRDDLLAFPLQGTDNSQHGVLITDDSGALRAYHNFAFRGLTGPGAVQEDDDGNLLAVTNNGDYQSGWVQFEEDSSLVVFNPYLTNTSTYNVIDLDSKNATGLGVKGNAAIIASAGDYFANPNTTGTVSLVELSSSNVLSTQASPSGLGLNGNLPYESGKFLLTGYNESSPIAVTDGLNSVPLNLPDDCGSGFVLGAQFVKVDNDFMQIVFNDHDFTTSEMSLYSLSGDLESNDWDCELIETWDANSAVSIMKYSSDQFCVATDDQVLFYQAQ